MDLFCLLFAHCCTAVAAVVDSEEIVVPLAAEVAVAGAAEHDVEQVFAELDASMIVEGVVGAFAVEVAAGRADGAWVSV